MDKHKVSEKRPYLTTKDSKWNSMGTLFSKTLKNEVNCKKSENWLWWQYFLLYAMPVRLREYWEISVWFLCDDWLRWKIVYLIVYWLLSTIWLQDGKLLGDDRKVIDIWHWDDWLF